MSEDSNTKKDNIDKWKQKLKNESQDLDFNLDFLGSDMFLIQRKKIKILLMARKANLLIRLQFKRIKMLKKRKRRIFLKQKKSMLNLQKKENLLKKDDDNLPDWLK